MAGTLERLTSLRNSATGRVAIGMVLGGVTGALLGPCVAGVGEVGGAVIGLIKMLAAPLVLFAILDSFLRSSVRARGGLIMVALAAINAALAVTIALVLANELRPGDS